jgi:hypothetical protein
MLRFNGSIRDVNNLNPELRSQWGSKLSMVYHYLKHNHDFENQQITMERFFDHYANQIFRPENVTSTGYSQTGSLIRTSYATNFGTRVHVGFTCGDKRLSHYLS